MSRTRDDSRASMTPSDPGLNREELPRIISDYNFDLTSSSSSSTRESGDNH